LAYVYKKQKIFSMDILTGNIISELCTLPMKKTYRVLTKLRVFERMLRTEPRAAVLCSENLILSYFGAIYNINVNTGEYNTEHLFRGGMNNPLSLTEVHNINGFSDCLLYGEYWGNLKEEPVAIYGRNLTNNKWEKYFEFSSKTVTHIHAIVPDKYRDRLLILTGDKDNESGFWEAKNDFHKVEPLLIGKQAFRSCSAIPLEEGILFATDTPLEENYIGLIKEEHGQLKIEKLYGLEGPCTNHYVNGDSYIFSTTVEPDSSVTGVKYLLSYKLGQGVKSRYSTLVAGNLKTGFREIKRFKKDYLPITLFQFGNICFPAGKSTKSLVFYPQAIKKYDGQLLSSEMYNN
jgi:hypothetical protein